jgi:DNA-binding response OmpR family regulator
MANVKDEQQPETPDLAGRRVLVADDCATDSANFTAWLARAGAHVEQVGTLEAACKALRDQTWDAVVLDRLFPDGDAFEWLAREHRQRGSLARSMPPCVLVSADLDEKTYRAVYDVGAVPLPKHHMVHPDVLLAAIGTAFRFAEQPRRDADPLDHPLLPRK